MTELNNEVCEMTFDDLDQVSGGSIVSWLVGLYNAAVGKNLMDAIHQPIVSPPKISLHMR